MGMTLTEKIIAAHCGRESVQSGEYVMAEVDLCLGNDITAPIAIDRFEEARFESVWDRRRIALIPDHFTPNKDIRAATLANQLRMFVREHNIEQ